MRTDNKTMLEAFEETGGRGDVLSLPLSYLKRMQAVPFDWFASVLHQLFKWFVSGDETPLEDPIANAELEGLKEEQRKNALRRKAFLVAQSDRIKRRWEKNKHEIPTGNPGNTTVYHGIPTITKTVTVNRNPNQSEGYGLRKDGLRDGGVGRPADAPPSPPVTATALTFKEANRFLWKSAPPLDEKHYTKEEIAKWDGYSFEDADFIVGDILLTIGEEGNKQTENALRKFYRELGAKVFFRAYARFDKDWHEVCDSGNEWEKPGAILIARLKKIQEAMAVFDAHMAAKSNPAPTCGSRG